MPTVIVESPALPTTGRVPFEQALSIGRSPDSDLQILDGHISKRHAILRSNAEEFLVEDLGSRNGTFLNGKRIVVPTQLNNGDVVQVGDSRLTFEHHPIDEQPHPKHRTSTTTMQIRKREVRHDFPPANQVGSPEMLSEDYDRLRLAWRLSMEIGFDRPLEDQAERIVDLLIQEFDADRGVLMLFPRGTSDRNDPENLRPIGVVTRKGDPKESVRVPRTVLRAVLEQRKGVLAADARSDARFDTSKSVIMQGIRSALCVPLTARSGNLVGVLALDATRVVNTFHEKDLIVLETVGVQIATAVENTLLVEQMREQAVARERLSRLLSPNLVEEVVSGQLKFTQAGETRHVTILFTDVRGYEPALRPGRGAAPPQLLLRRGRRHPLPPRGHPRQVHGRRHDGALRRAYLPARRPRARGPRGDGDPGRRAQLERGARQGRPRAVPHRHRHRRGPGRRRCNGQHPDHVLHGGRAGGEPRRSPDGRGGHRP